MLFWSEIGIAHAQPHYDNDLCSSCLDSVQGLDLLVPCS